MNIACYDCKQILEGKQATGITGNHKIVCPVCNGENIKETKAPNAKQVLANTKAYNKGKVK